MAIMLCVGLVQPTAGPAQTSAPNERYGLGYLRDIGPDGQWPPYPSRAPVLYGPLERAGDAAMTEREQRLLSGWEIYLAPGLYRVRSLHQQVSRVTESCLGFVPAAGLEAPRLGLMPCDRPGATLAVLAHDGPGVILRVPGRGCATLARGVAFGAPRIDVLPCDYAPGAAIARVTSPDQSWAVTIERSVRLGANARQRFGMDWGQSFRIVSDRGSKCWEMRVGGDVVRNECRYPYDVPLTPLKSNPLVGMRVPGEVPTQSFTFEPAGPLPRDLADQQRGLGWDVGPAGQMRRAVGVPGFDMPGNDIARTATADDRGLDCADQCRRNRDCSAFTWVPPGMQEASAVCYLKRGSPRIVRNPATVSGYALPSANTLQSIDPTLRGRVGDAGVAPVAPR